MFSMPEAFRRDYTNSEEGTAVFYVLPDTRYLEAYKLYLSAIDDCAKGLYPVGFSKLTQALAYDPSLVSALNAYGAACLLSNTHLSQGAEKLRQALRIQPHFRLALINLARIYDCLGQHEKALEFYQRARAGSF